MFNKDKIFKLEINYRINNINKYHLNKIEANLL